MIAYPYMYARVSQAVFLQHGKQQAAQRHLTCGDIHCPRLHISAFRYFGFSRFYMLKGYSHMLIQALALGSEPHAAVAA